MLILATAQQDGPLVLREGGATKLGSAAPRLQAHGPLTFQPAQAHLARSASGKLNTCPQAVPNKGGNVRYSLWGLGLPHGGEEEG